MEPGERYYQLSMLGRETFLEVAAPAALVEELVRPRLARGTVGEDLPSMFQAAEDTDLTYAHAAPTMPARKPRIHPLMKHPGTPFVDLITVGRTVGNDIVLGDKSISRFQAFFRRRHHRWYVCDAGSRNGTMVEGERLPVRSEVALFAGCQLSFGTVRFRFLDADSLYDLLSTGRLQ